MNRLINSEAKGESTTLPSPRSNDALAPSLFARKMRVVTFSDIFKIKEE